MGSRPAVDRCVPKGTVESINIFFQRLQPERLEGFLKLNCEEDEEVRGIEEGKQEERKGRSYEKKIVFIIRISYMSGLFAFVMMDL